MAALKTSEVARQAGVNVETLRFYERKGLLPMPPRRTSGYRDYPPEAVGRVRFIKRAQELGFTLKEVQELLSLGEASRAKAAQVRRLAEAKAADIERKIEDLQAIKRTLEGLLSACDGRGPAASCPIIESLGGCPRCAGPEAASP